MDNDIEKYLDLRLEETKTWINNSVRSRYIILTKNIENFSILKKQFLIELIIGLPEEIVILPNQKISATGQEFVVDFAVVLPISKKILIIEVDEDETVDIQKRDFMDRCLVVSFIPFLRFTKNDIQNNLPSVIRQIRFSVEKFDR